MSAIHRGRRSSGHTGLFPAGWTMTFFDFGKRAILVAVFAISAACGGGGGDDGGGSNNPPPPPPPVNTGIGSAGGTVTEASGAKVVIPAGALATNVNIQ